MLPDHKINVLIKDLQSPQAL